MPLIVLCGFPCSGKSSRANDIEQHLASDHPDRKVIRIDDALSGHSRDVIYGESRMEKEVRSLLKSEVEKALNASDVVLLDAPNYIKGFRYELFCAAKLAQTPHAVVFCDVPPKTVLAWHNDRPVDLRYSDKIMQDLLDRLEVPDERNRWDAPLFRLNPEDDTPCAEVCAAVLDRLPPRPNQSTQSVPAGPSELLQQRHSAANAVVRHLVRELPRAVPGDQLAVPQSSEKFVVVRRSSPAELQRAMRQFLVVAKGRSPDEDIGNFTTAFVQYLNGALR